MERKATINLLIKSLFSFFLIIVAGFSHRVLLLSVLELFIILIFSNIVLRIKWGGWIISSILFFLFNLQLLFWIMSHSFLDIGFFKNLDSIQGLSGRAATYIFLVVIIMVLSVFPAKRLKSSLIVEVLLLGILLLADFCSLRALNVLSPLYGYRKLYSQYDYEKKEQEAKNALLVYADKFYQESVEDYVKKDPQLPDRPNLVLIFTEGLSQQIVEDERKIMPNVEAFEENALFFDNYYNHTAATYWGLIAQLYSGFQFDNYEKNELFSIQKVLQEEGYYTTFINTEPNNNRFTSYLEKFDFDELICERGSICTGQSKTLSDKESYQLLWEVMEEKETGERPYFISMYTYGTHVSLDSIDEKYGDGKDPELNKFYDNDYQFGEFMRKFNDSDFSKDTVIVFTTDHCTYYDDAFENSFPNYERKAVFFDRIPLFFYYKGIEPDRINVSGRTSINLVPTILDFLDISRENYFLGDSLFRRNGENRVMDEYYFGVIGDYSSSHGGEIASLTDSESDAFGKNLAIYHALSENPTNSSIHHDNSNYSNQSLTGRE